MSSERTPEHLARETDPSWKKVAGMLRRMVVRFTAKGIWELGGFSRLSEVVRAEVFQGLGFWARPPGGVTVEAVVLNIGGSDHPVVVALRDEATRKAVADALLADETVQYNSLSRVYVKADGTIEARTHGGAAAALATKADVDNLRAWLASLVLPVSTTGTAAAQTGTAGPPTGAPPGTSSAPPTAAGTTILKAE